MDPLSITASAITVVAAIQQAVKCAERLRAIRQAPKEIKLLLEEVADLSELLNQCQAVQRPPAYGDGSSRPIESPKGLDWQISRTVDDIKRVGVVSRTPRRSDRPSQN